VSDRQTGHGRPYSVYNNRPHLPNSAMRVNNENNSNDFVADRKLHRVSTEYIPTLLSQCTSLICSKQICWSSHYTGPFDKSFHSPVPFTRHKKKQFYRKRAKLSNPKATCGQKSHGMTSHDVACQSAYLACIHVWAASDNSRQMLVSATCKLILHSLK